MVCVATLDGSEPSLRRMKVCPTRPSMMPPPDWPLLRVRARAISRRARKGSWSPVS